MKSVSVVAVYTVWWLYIQCGGCIYSVVAVYTVCVVTVYRVWWLYIQCVWWLYIE